MALRAAELEVLFTANTDQVEKAERQVKQTGQTIEKKPIVAKVDGDAKDALDSMDRVEAEAKRIVSAKTMATVDANIERAEKSFMRVYERLDYLKSVRTELDVEADIKRAEANLSKVQRNLDGLRSARAVMEVDADTVPAEEALEDVAEVAGESGRKGGLDAGSALIGGIVGALASTPIVGAIAGIAEAAGEAIRSAFEEGLAIDARQDRLQALTGLNDTDVRRLSYAAGEAYANLFGESIEANMDTTRLALQFNILDENATTRDAQRVVQGLAGIADVLGEDVRPVATAVTTLLRTGLAASADDAFDLIAAGARNGVDRGEDLLDTFTEYPVVLRRLGLTGEESLGLLNQALDAGARNSDVAADALKEFQIRATDASDASAAGFERLGLNAGEMTAKIAAGGESAREGLSLVLDQLRATEDPVVRNAAAVELFGTKAEDLGDALFAMDLSSAVDELDGVTGSAQRMFDTLADNDASKMEQAKRNIEVGIQGIQGALAAAFSEPLGDAADWISQNRGPMLKFFLDLANGALDFGGAIVEGIASGTEALGDFVGSISQVVYGLAAIPAALGDQETSDALVDMANGMVVFSESADATADGIRKHLNGALGEARERLNEFGEPAVALGYLNDATQRTARSVADLADGSGTLDDRLRGVVDRLREELIAADRAEESQDNLRDRFAATTGALVDQLEQMGYTREEAEQLIATYGAVPSLVETAVELSGIAEADAALDEITRERVAVIRAQIGSTHNAPVTGGMVVQNARGNLLEFMGRGLTPMAPIAQMVPPSTWRVVGDRGDVPELYAPLDGSARSWALIMEAIRRMGGTPMADGGITGGVQQSPIVGLRMAGRVEIGQDGIGTLVDARVIDVITSGVDAAGGGFR